MRAPAGWVCVNVRSAFNQTLMVILINVPAISFGLALGWVSLASGEAGSADGGKQDESGAVIAAVIMFVACFIGVPLSAKAITYGRKIAVIAASACFVVCWSFKLISLKGSGWWLVAGRVAAGLGGAAAWALAPLLAREMCSAKWRGAAVSALPLAHNVGVLLMYLAADAKLHLRTVMWWCLGLSVGHLFIFMLVPESPSFLAAKGKDEEARMSLAWLRGQPVHAPELDAELKTLPPAETHDQSSLALVKEMWRDRQRRVALIIGGLAVVGQEACGVLAILQYAERLFVLAREGSSGSGMQIATPARLALLVGAAQLAASALSLYLVERLGRRPLIVWCAWLAGGALAAAAAALWWQQPEGAALAIALAVAADAAGLQPAPYALLADMFHYEYRGCALMLVTVAACAGNALEVGVFPAVVARGGVAAALTLAAMLTSLYAVFATCAVPETRLKTPEEIYQELCPERMSVVQGTCDSVKVNSDLDCRTIESKQTMCTRF
ncbi:unnamed protein product [Leptosia nina]|uniref:Major facilitator superfamily (MFS) profile domain-containing protein n=1 Tax=Leptosia nina TaxID=320188 RepID=A0AAV1J3V7_9NEOP